MINLLLDCSIKQYNDMWNRITMFDLNKQKVDALVYLQL